VNSNFFDKAELKRDRVALAPSELQTSIIVNSYNPKGDARVRAMTEFALRCYSAFTGPAHELILVDGHTEPDTRLEAICNEFGYRYIQFGRRLSFAEGYNAGLRAARAPSCVLAASDVFVVEGWLEALLTAAERTGAWMVAPYLSESDYPAQRTHYPLMVRPFVPDFLTFNLNLMSRQCLETVGYIDEQFSGCFNDVDYTLRIRRHGGEVAIVFCGEITHLGRGTLGASVVSSMYAHDLRLFEAKWPGVWNQRNSCLNRDRGLKKWLLRLEHTFPGKFSRRCLEIMDRIEPIISPVPRRVCGEAHIHRLNSNNPAHSNL
jgi:GT2 family glycosyltransferase